MSAYRSRSAGKLPDHPASADSARIGRPGQGQRSRRLLAGVCSERPCTYATPNLPVCQVYNYLNFLQRIDQLVAAERKPNDQ